MTTTRGNGILRSLASLAVPAGLLAWGYWPTLEALAAKWAHDPQYSHGYFVPLFAAYLLWHRRSHLVGAAWTVNGWGVLVLAVGLGLRLVATFVFLPWLDAGSFLVCLTGLFLLLGGPPALRWAWPALGFLLFMLPLPYRLQVAMANPLQRVATVATTYLLQMAGVPALSEGNIIRLNEAQIGVIEACNGLSMLITFFALSTAVAILINRHPAHKLIVLLSAVPIALVANVARLAATAVAADRLGEAAGKFVLHDLAGWLMMPLALLLMALELWLLHHLLIPVGEDEPRGRLVGGHDARPAA